MNPKRRQSVGFHLLLLGLCLSTPAALLAQDEQAHQDFLLGYRTMQRGEYKQAGEAFDRFLQDHPGDPKRGDAIYYRAFIAQRAGENELAAKLLRNVPETEHVPQFAVFLLRGQVHCDRGEFDHALAALERIDLRQVKQPVTEAAIHQLTGRAYRAVDNLAGAATELRKAADIDSPIRSRALIDLARVYIIQGRHDKAIKALDECIATKDVTYVPEAARLAGAQCNKLGKYPEAIRYYQMVVERYQTTKHFSAAVVGMMRAQFSSAQYRPLLETFNQHGENLDAASRTSAIFLAGSAYLEQEQYAQAVTTFNSVAPSAAAANEHDDLLYNKALAQFELERFDEMGKTLTVLFKTHPQSKLNLDGQFLLAAADARDDKFTRGVERLSAIVNFRPRHPYHDQALLQRAQLYQENDELLKAVEDYKTYLQQPGKIDDAGRFTDHETVLRVLDLQYRLGNYDAVEKSAERLAQSGVTGEIEQEAMYRRALALVRIQRPDEKPEARLQRREEAAQILTKLIDKYDEAEFRSQWHFWRGLLQVTTEQREQGLADLALAADAQDLTAEQRANALRMMAIALREANRNEEAVEKMLRLKKESGLTADEMFWLARYFVTQERAAEAVAFLEPLLDEKRNIPPLIRGNARFLAGKCYHEAGEYERAEAVFRDLIEKRHAYTMQARLALGRVLRDAGKTDEALAQFEALSRSDGVASRIAAESLYDAALVYLQRAEERNRADDAAGRDKARKQAENHLRRIIVLFAFADLSPLPEMSFITLAEMLDGQGDAAEAKKLMKEMSDKFKGPHAIYGGAVVDVYNQKRGEALFKLRRLREQEDVLEPELVERVEILFKRLEPGA